METRSGASVAMRRRSGGLGAAQYCCAKNGSTGEHSYSIFHETCRRDNTGYAGGPTGAPACSSQSRAGRHRKRPSAAHRCKTLSLRTRAAVLVAPLFLQLTRTCGWHSSDLRRGCCLAFQFPMREAERLLSRPTNHARPRSRLTGTSIDSSGIQQLRRLEYKANTDDIDNDSLMPATHFDRLDQSTRDILDLEFMPLGDLRQEDLSSIASLMMAWAKTKSRTGALMAEKLVKRIVDDINVGNTDVKVTTRLYTICIDAWAKVGGIEAADRAQQIHDGLIEKNLRSGDVHLAPSTVSYNALLNAWSKSKSSDAPYKAEKILSEMLDREQTRPDVISFTAAIDCYAKSCHPNAGNEGLRLFRQMENLASDDGDRVANIYACTALANAIAKSADDDAPQKAEALLEEMKEKARSNWKMLPTTSMFNSVINAHVRRKGPGAAHRATDLLNKMIEDGVEPDALSWKLVITAWASSDDDEALRHGEEMLLRSEQWALAKMRELEQKGLSALPHQKVKLDRAAYNAVLSSFVRAQECDDAAQRALAILKRMIDLADAGVAGVRPNVHSWNSVLKTMSRTQEPGIAAKAEAVIGYMIREGGVMPDRFSFTAVLNTYQRNPMPGSAARADAIVRQMQRLYLAGKIEDPPDTYHFTILLTCWSKSKEHVAAYRCRQILDYMLQQWRAGNDRAKPNTRAYNAVIESYGRSKNVEEAGALLDHLITASEKDPSLSPDAFSFRSVIAAWTRSRRRDAGRRAIEVLDKYLEFRPESVDSKPFALIIEWFSRRRDLPDSALNAETLLDRMIALYEKNSYHQIVPSIYSFINVINAHATSRHRQSGKIERIQEKMLDFSRRNNLSRLRRNVIVSNAVISALATSGEIDAGERAESILDDLLLGSAVGDENLTPNTDSYQGVILAWAKSRTRGKAQKAYRILHRMIDDYENGNMNCRPTAQAYTTVLNAAAFSNGNAEEEHEAFRIATTTLNELYNCPYCDGPTSAAMGTFIKACGRLGVPPDVSLESLEAAFQKSCELGLVDPYVLDQFFYACPVSTGLYRKVFGDLIPKDGPEKVKVAPHSIPKEWRRNVRYAEEEQRRRQRTRVSNEFD